MPRAVTTFAVAAMFSIASFGIGWQSAALRFGGGTAQLPDTVPCDVGSAPTKAPTTQ